MKLDEGDHIVGVDICTEKHDVLLTSARGQAIRFPVTDVRVFAGRSSTGVRGIRLADDDRLISMAILHHIEASPEEKRAYLKRAAAMRRAATGETGEPEVIELDEEGGTDEVDLSIERYAELGAGEQFVLTLSKNGYGKRSSAYEYRVSGRGGKGIIAMVVNDRNGDLAGTFPVEEGDQIMLVTDGGQLIRCPVNDVRIAGRSTQGVTVFKTAPGESVVSVEHIREEDDDGASVEEGPVVDDQGPPETGDEG
jgi:DNA gyrase subunit A